jgi:hypothetical protein
VTKRCGIVGIIALVMVGLPILTAPAHAKVAPPTPPSASADAAADSDLKVLIDRGLTVGAVTAQSAANSPFVSVLPRRLMDTRDGTGGIRGKIPAANTVKLRVVGAGTGNAEVATAVALNVTALDSNDAGFITVWPCDKAEPATSNLNFAAKQVIPNAVVTRISADGYICLKASAAVGVLVDTSGWFPAGSYMQPKSPDRLVDTRNSGMLAANTPLEVPVTGRFDVPADASATLINVTAVGAVADGFVTVYPCGQGVPVASNINFRAGQNVPNLVLAAVGAGGKTCIQSSVATHILADVTAWFPPAADVKAQVPARIMDTRIARPDSAVPGRIGAGETLTLPLRQTPDNPLLLRSTGAIVNVTVTGPSTSGFMTVFPCGASRPLASNLNFQAGVDVANLVITSSNADGTLCLYSDSVADVIVDVNGLFTSVHHAVPFSTATATPLPVAHTGLSTAGPAQPLPATQAIPWSDASFSRANLPRGDWGYLTAAQTPAFVGELVINAYDFATSGIQYRCSGTVVARDVILTAGHCVLDFPAAPTTATPNPSPLPLPAIKVSFTPGLYGAASPLGEWHTASAADIHPSLGFFDDLRADTPEVTAIDETTNDWALIKLAPNGSGQHIGDVTGIVPVAPDLGRAPLAKLSLHYPAGGFFSEHCRSGSPLNCQPVFCTSPNPPVFSATIPGRYVVSIGCPLMNGSSGGGVFSFYNGQWWVVSVISRGPDSRIDGEPNPTATPSLGAYTVNTIGPELNSDAYPALLAVASA